MRSPCTAARLRKIQRSFRRSTSTAGAWTYQVWRDFGRSLHRRPTSMLRVVSSKAHLAGVSRYPFVSDAIGSRCFDLRPIRLSDRRFRFRSHIPGSCSIHCLESACGSGDYSDSALANYHPSLNIGSLCVPIVFSLFLFGIIAARGAHPVAPMCIGGLVQGPTPVAYGD